METIQIIQKDFRDDAMSAAQEKVWHKRFKGGRDSVESDQCSGRSATSRSLKMLSVYGPQSTKIGN